MNVFRTYILINILLSFSLFSYSNAEEAQNKKINPNKNSVKNNGRIGLGFGANYFINTQSGTLLYSKNAGFGSLVSVLDLTWSLNSKKVKTTYKVNPGQYSSNQKEISGTKNYSWKFFELNYAHPMYYFNIVETKIKLMGLVGYEFHQFPILYAPTSTTFLSESEKLQTAVIGLGVDGRLSSKLLFETHFKYLLPMTASYTATSKFFIGGDIELLYIYNSKFYLSTLWSGSWLNQKYKLKNLNSGEQTLFYSALTFGIGILF